MTSDNSKPTKGSLEQTTHGKQSPSIAAGGNVNIHYGGGKEEQKSEQAAQKNANKPQQSTAVKVALIGAAATVLVAMIGLATKCSGDSEPTPSSPPTSRIEINAPVIHTGEGNQAISGGDVNINIEEKPQ